jgi:CrcB protein
MVVNVTGCFVLGVLTGVVLYHGVSGDVKTVLGTGCMGAYTTFSTFTYETVRLAEDGAAGDAIRNVVANIILGLIAAAAGLGLASAL